MRLHRAFVPFIAACAFAAPAVGAPTRPFTVHDLVAMERIVELDAALVGGRAVLTVSRVDLEANRRRSSLYLVGPSGEPRRLTHAAGASDTDPRFAPDGRTVYFISTRSGSRQVWRIDVDGGEAVPVTQLPLDVVAFGLSGDGQKLAVSLEVFPDCRTLDCTTDRLARTAARKESGRVFDRLPLRHWDSWRDGRRQHLFVVPTSGGLPVDVMKGMDADCPSRPDGGPSDFTFTPDGKGLVFAAKNAGREEMWSTNFDLFVVPVDGSARPKSLTPGNSAWDTAPTFSPDGKTLAYLAMRAPVYESDRFRIVVRDWASGQERVLTESWDRSPTGLTWAADGRTLYAPALDLGQAPLFGVDVASGAVRTVVPNGHVDTVAATADRLFVVRSDLNHPAELYALESERSPARQRTAFNAGRLAAVRLGEPSQFEFSGANGDPVRGYLVKPIDFDPKKKYPVAFLIHGGPQGSFGNQFHYRWNPQTYAAAGYATVMIDFHGSVGYGQAFTDAIQNDWAGKPFEDLQKGLAYVLAQNPWMDGQRVAALGASYGAFMVNWIAGKWPDRFRCLVSHDGNLDERLAYYDTEELWFPEHDHSGVPWLNPENYTGHNPIDYVGQWKTPMLVIHGALDFRIPDTQGFSTFTALQRRGIPSKLLYFPDENHWVVKPSNSILWHETVIDWLDQWLKGQPPRPRP